MGKIHKWRNAKHLIDHAQTQIVNSAEKWKEVNSLEIE